MKREDCPIPRLCQPKYGAANEPGESKASDFYVFDEAALLSSPGAITGCRKCIMARSFADGVAHVAEAAAVNQVNDEFELVETLAVRDLGLIASLCKRLEARFDQFTHASTKYGLFAKEVSFSLLGERGFQNASTRAAESLGVSEGKRLRGTAGILLDGEQRGSSSAFRENFANTVAGSLWSDHGDIDSSRWFDGAEANVKTVREHQSLAGFEIRLDGLAIELGLLGVRNENHDDVSPGCGLGR